MEKVAKENLALSPIHGYKNVSEILKQEQTKRILTPNYFLPISGKEVNFTFMNEVNFTAGYKMEIIHFQFQLIPGDGKVHIVNLDAVECKPQQKTLPEAEFKCEIVPNEQDKSIMKLKSVKMTLKDPKSHAFIILQPTTVFIDLKKPGNHDHTANFLRANATLYGDVYLFQEPENPFLNLIHDQPDNQDTCYTLFSTQRIPNIDVYFTFEGVSQGIHLNSLNTLTHNQMLISFCINDFLALRNLKKYQLTLVAPGTNPSEFEIALVKKSHPGRFEDRIRTPRQTPAEETEEQITGSWYYFHQALFDYQINYDVKFAPMPARFWICDVVASCFEYSMYLSNPPQNNYKYAYYTMPYQFQHILAQSPFVRIQADRPVDSKLQFFYQRYE